MAYFFLQKAYQSSAKSKKKKLLELGVNVSLVKSTKMALISLVSRAQTKICQLVDRSI
jgi:hypothetical protein